jgi:hypothetical protein
MLEKWIYYKNTHSSNIISKLLEINDIIEVKQHPLYIELFYIYSNKKNYINSMMISSNILYNHFIKLSEFRDNYINSILNT